ncbi:hypothetical conserved protein [Candidatus Nitrosoglobus terrae]|uniref:Hypothetical conserved protein n=1 Tax=Candidatus Nitrosoglobus terrae TaxID=1630141 RepID=A0A1Q2SLW4_9GAMM|nr:HrgA protein [Candidatus Nitrosoglobus terrae]BAW80110.1 hypothetical conserved protein [Candidatus Nitrosoglobus terrae]
MSRLSQVQRIAQWLMAHPQERFTARQLAENIVSRYPEDYEDKRINSRFINNNAFISQIVAEIGSQKNGIARCHQGIRWQDKPRPRVYWFDPDPNLSPMSITEIEDEDSGEDAPIIRESASLTERDLYPLLMQYLKAQQLYCMRIDEKRSKNQRGNGGNHWLHPDMVAMQPVAKNWHELVRTCVLKGGGQSVRLWAFEVKKELNRSTVRQYFFQAVSNSSWANEGYLVGTEISGDGTEEELRILSALHGIGVMILDTKNPTESEIMLPARAKLEIDWHSVNRLVAENEDMKEFVDLVSTYYETGRLRSKDWNRIN